MTATRRAIMASIWAALLPGETAFAGDRLTRDGRRLASLLALPATAHHVAAAYLRSLGGMHWRRAALELDMPAVLAPAGAIIEMQDLRTWLGERIRADFAAGVVIEVDGWQLSRTEVGACLLVLGVG